MATNPREQLGEGGLCTSCMPKNAATVIVWPALRTAQPALGRGYRTFSHKRWVIIFRESNGAIEVMRVVDGAQDYGRLFGREQ